ncbi:MAG: hypothetical protein JWR57_1071 [Mycetocola sp.]|nr:hypothetical protein [Mycetocola sp.]
MGARPRLRHRTSSPASAEFSDIPGGRRIPLCPVDVAAAVAAAVDAVALPTMVVFARRFHAVCGDAGSGTAVCGNATSATRPRRTTVPGTVPFVHPAHTTGSRQVLRHSGRMKHPADRAVCSSGAYAEIAPGFSTSGADERAAGARRWFIRRRRRAQGCVRAQSGGRRHRVPRVWSGAHGRRYTMSPPAVLTTTIRRLTTTCCRPSSQRPVAVRRHDGLLPPVVTATCCRASSQHPVAVRRHSDLLPRVVTTPCCRPSSQRPVAARRHSGLLSGLSPSVLTTTARRLHSYRRPRRHPHNYLPPRAAFSAFAQACCAGVSVVDAPPAGTTPPRQA